MAAILFVEDDADVRFIVEHVLLDAQHQVDTAETVAGGLELLNSGEYELVIADGKLPDGSGLDVADRAVEQGIKAFVMTGYAFTLPRRDTYEILLKPLRPREIIAAVEKTLAGCSSA